MTGLNHVTTGALIAGAASNPLISIPAAFLSHYILDAIPHFAVEMPDDVFERNRQKHFRVAAAVEFMVAIAAIITFTLILKPVVPWWVTLLTILAAILPDLGIIYRGIKEVLTKKEDRKNFLTKWHIDLNHHHSHVVLGLLFELAYFAAALTIIIFLINHQ